ncbi:hypothetical protein CGRA01v4_00495 [Colletotrichum graminicola]|uniref:Uncharacterized protein n=1 Tax=Colletotrichum graminicola (strain M1.001 / M2 / FGSC 10212) TaxID=645133 RepID=E3QQ84_COLGM|nr:uncharacterized protein GLRG_08166 [Colletotrichum graminicola M1.001]EFQ33022.1 hypothetical protein GLRG_08166 [Colletotrichum graminicola M1.001]WDK09217.1 hypothetical protein CGRA01v4_00495 [Colletotrichum graminicola]
MVAPSDTLRRRVIRRPRYRRDDMKIEIRDDDHKDKEKDEDSSDDEDSPSPSKTKFSENAQPTRPPSQQPPPPAFNPADPTQAISSAGSSDQPQQTAGSSVTSQPAPAAFPQTTAASGAQSTNGISRGGNESGLGRDRSNEVGWTPTAIAFGTIAIAALCLVIGVGIWWFLRFRKRRRARQMQERGMPPDGLYWDPAMTFSPPSAPSRRAPSSVMAELMGQAYAAENGGYYGNPDRNSLTPQGYLDEKRVDPTRQLPILEPAPVAQPNVRNSIASWIRRHHPLKLNPMGGRSSVYSTRSVSPGSGPVNATAPPVPAVPAAYRSTDRVGSPGPGNPNNPQYASSSRYDTDSQSTRDDTNSILSLYQNRPPHEPDQREPWLMEPPAPLFAQRGVSMAPTEVTDRTDSTWRTWGAGASRPMNQAPAADAPRPGWIERCIKFGGLK